MWFAWVTGRKCTGDEHRKNGIIRSFNVQVGQGPLLKNFVISELEKRRKLGYIPAERMYYYKSSSGQEIDLLFEVGGTLYAMEIKSTQNPGKKDVRSLKTFEPRKNIPVERILFYPGESYATLDNVSLVPVASLFRGR